MDVASASGALATAGGGAGRSSAVAVGTGVADCRLAETAWSEVCEAANELAAAAAAAAAFFAIGAFGLKARPPFFLSMELMLEI